MGFFCFGPIANDAIFYGDFDEVYIIEVEEEKFIKVCCIRINKSKKYVANLVCDDGIVFYLFNNGFASGMFLIRKNNLSLFSERGCVFLILSENIQADEYCFLKTNSYIIAKIVALKDKKPIYFISYNLLMNGMEFGGCLELICDGYGVLYCYSLE